MAEDVVEDASMDEDDFKREEELHQLLKGLPSNLLEDSETDDSTNSISSMTTPPEEEGEEAWSSTLAPSSAGTPLPSVAPDPINQKDKMAVSPLTHISSYTNLTGEGSLQRSSGVDPAESKPSDQLKSVSTTEEMAHSEWSQQINSEAHGPTQLAILQPAVESPVKFNMVEDMETLQKLYKSRGRRIAELTEKVKLLEKRIADDELVLIRQQKEVKEREVILQKEHNCISSQCNRLSNENAVLTEELGKLTLEIDSLQNENLKLKSELSSAHSTISSLQTNLSLVQSSDTIDQMRQKYEHTIASLKEKHQDSQLKLQKEIDSLKETKHALEDRLSFIDNNPAQPDRMSDNAYHDLVAEKEDLACAVSTLEENKLQLQREINQLNEVAKDRQRCVDELRSKVNQLLSDVNTKEMENQSVNAKVQVLEYQINEMLASSEKDKKTALEECRSACLRLHEQSASRLHNAHEAEKKFLTEQHTREMEDLKVEVQTLQSKVEALTKDKNVSDSDHESRVQDALDVAKQQWREQLQDTIDANISIALEKAEAKYEQRLKREKIALEGRVRTDCLKKYQSDLEREKTAFEERVRTECLQKYKNDLDREKTALEEKVRTDCLQEYKNDLEREKTALEEKVREERAAMALNFEKWYKELSTKTKAELSNKEALQNALVSKHNQDLSKAQQKWKKEKEALIQKLEREYNLKRQKDILVEVERVRSELKDDKQRCLDEMKSRLVLEHQHHLKDAIGKAKEHYEGVFKQLKVKLTDEQRSIHSQAILKLEEELTLTKRENVSLEARVQRLKHRNEKVITVLDRTSQALSSDLEMWLRDVLKRRTCVSCQTNL